MVRCLDGVSNADMNMAKQPEHNCDTQKYGRVKSKNFSEECRCDVLLAVSATNWQYRSYYMTVPLLLYYNVAWANLCKDDSQVFLKYELRKIKFEESYQKIKSKSGFSQYGSKWWKMCSCWINPCNLVAMILGRFSTTLSCPNPVTNSNSRNRYEIQIKRVQERMSKWKIPSNMICKWEDIKGTSMVRTMLPEFKRAYSLSAPRLEGSLSLIFYSTYGTVMSCAEDNYHHTIMVDNLLKPL